jgi:uncharacterized membrane protein YbhN (UPF0104 family)
MSDVDPAPSSAEEEAEEVADFVDGARQSRSPLRRILGDIVLPLVFAALLIAFVWRERDRLDPLWDAPIATLLVLGVLVAVVHFLNSTEFWVLYRAHGVRTGIFENWFLFLASQLGNLMPGQPGTVYRLRYMRVVHKAKYTLSAAVYAADFVATLAGAAVVALIGVIGAGLTGEKFSWIMLLISLGVFTLAVLMAVAPVPKFHWAHGRVARLWRSFHGGFEQMRDDPKTAITVALLEVAKYLVYAVRFAVAFSLLGVREPIWLYLVLAPAAGVAGFIAITPGAFGFREAFVAAAAAAMGAGLDSGLLAATADRAVLLATSIILGGVGFALTYRRLAVGAARDTRVRA